MGRNFSGSRSFFMSRCSAAISFRNPASTARSRQFVRFGRQPLPVRLKVATGDRVTTIPISNGTLHRRVVLLGIRLPQPRAIVGATLLNLMVALPLTGLDGL